MVEQIDTVRTTARSRRLKTSLIIAAGSLFGLREAAAAPPVFALSGNKCLWLAAATVWKPLEWLAILSFLGGGLLALYLLHLQHRRLQKREEKLATLKQELAAALESAHP